MHTSCPSAPCDDLRRCGRAAYGHLGQPEHAPIQIGQVSERVTRLEAVHSSRGLTHVEERLTHVEERLTHVEERLTRVEERLTRVEERLTGIEDSGLPPRDEAAAPASP